MKLHIFNILILCCIIDLSFGQSLITGYTDKLSYRAGEEITFFINSPVSATNNFNLVDISGNFVPNISIPIDIFTQTINVDAQSQLNNNAWEVGFQWTPSTLKYTVPDQSELKSGLYILFPTDIRIIIKGDKSSTALDLVIVIPTNTDEAYSNIGGHNMYDELPNPDPGNHDTYPVVSFFRPFGGTPIYYDSFLKWFIGTSYNSFSVNVISDQDMDDYSEIENAKLLIIIGHSEYWTREGRRNFDFFVDQGNDALVLSGNTMWKQVRYLINDSDPNNVNPQMIYYGIDNIISDDECGPLLKAIQWDEHILNYSILSSLGSAWGAGASGTINGGKTYGGFGFQSLSTTPSLCHTGYGGFNGYKVILPQSPILNDGGINITPAFNQDDIIQLATGEFDGSLMSNADVDNPILDVTALGFYRAEIVAFDRVTIPWDNDHLHFFPLMAFQKTCSSGRVINVNSNMWCGDNGIGGVTCICPDDQVHPDSRISKITARMIALLYSRSNIFSNNQPTSFDLKPSALDVSYSACHYSTIDITPCGITMSPQNTPDHPDEGFKYDDENVLDIRIIDDCRDCHRQTLRLGNPTPPQLQHTYTSTHSPFTSPSPKTKTAAELNADISPNPNSGSFILNLKTVNTNGTNEVYIYNSLGSLIRHQMVTSTTTQFDLFTEAKGVYFVKIQNGENVLYKKVILQ